MEERERDRREGGGAGREEGRDWRRALSLNTHTHTHTHTHTPFLSLRTERLREGCSQRKEAWVLPAFETPKHVGLEEGRVAVAEAAAGAKAGLAPLVSGGKLQHFAVVSGGEERALFECLCSDDALVVL